NEDPAGFSIASNNLTLNKGVGNSFRLASTMTINSITDLGDGTEVNLTNVALAATITLNFNGAAPSGFVPILGVGFVGHLGINSISLSVGESVRLRLSHSSTGSPRRWLVVSMTDTVAKEI